MWHLWGKVGPREGRKIPCCVTFPKPRFIHSTDYDGCGLWTLVECTETSFVDRTCILPFISVSRSHLEFFKRSNIIRLIFPGRSVRLMLILVAICRISVGCLAVGRSHRRMRTKRAAWMLSLTLAFADFLLRWKLFFKPVDSEIDVVCHHQDSCRVSDSRGICPKRRPDRRLPSTVSGRDKSFDLCLAWSGFVEVVLIT